MELRQLPSVRVRNLWMVLMSVIQLCIYPPKKKKAWNSSVMHGQNCSWLRFTDRQTDFSQASLSVSLYISLDVYGKAGTLYDQTYRGVRRICISGTL